MSELGDAFDEIRVALATEYPFADLCDLIPPPTLTAQGAGHTMTNADPVEDVPCKHEQLGGGGVQVKDGETLVTKTHRVALPFTAQTVAIDRRYQIRVHARGLNAETIFEQPVREFDSGSPLLNVLVTMVEGFGAAVV